MTKDHITLDEFRIACRAINVKTGVIVLPNEDVVRDKLETEVTK
jgi:hypothetical protein